MALRFNEEFLAKFEVHHLLGEGGMGIVYRATQRSLSRPVAVKFLAGAATSKDFLRRFEVEAKTAAQIFHSHLVAVIEYGQMDEFPYIVFEFVDGPSLRELLEKEAPVRPVHRALDLVRQAALGLARAHQTGIIHRDVKPENLLVGAGEVIKVADFGVAKVTDPSGNRTSTGLLLGTPTYMSPEQALERPLTHTSDIYSLGVVLYELLSGQVPFVRPSALEVLAAHLSDPVPELPRDVPQDVVDIVHRALAKAPAERFASMDEMVATLAEWIERARRAPAEEQAREDDRETGRAGPVGAGARNRPGAGHLRTATGLVRGGAGLGAAASGPGGAAGAGTAGGGAGAPHRPGPGGMDATLSPPGGAAPEPVRRGQTGRNALPRMQEKTGITRNTGRTPQLSGTGTGTGRHPTVSRSIPRPMSATVPGTGAVSGVSRLPAAPPDRGRTITAGRVLVLASIAAAAAVARVGFDRGWFRGDRMPGPPGAPVAALPSRPLARGAPGSSRALQAAELDRELSGSRAAGGALRPLARSWEALSRGRLPEATVAYAEWIAVAGRGSAGAAGATGPSNAPAAPGNAGGPVATGAGPTAGPPAGDIALAQALFEQLLVAVLEADRQALPGAGAARCPPPFAHAVDALVRLRDGNPSAAAGQLARFITAAGVPGGIGQSGPVALLHKHCLLSRHARAPTPAAQRLMIAESRDAAVVYLRTFAHGMLRPLARQLYTLAASAEEETPAAIDAALRRLDPRPETDVPPALERMMDRP